MLKSGDVVLALVHFTDSVDLKRRPAVVLFEEDGNIVVAGVTSNTDRKGIPLTKKEGALVESVIRPNYIFTISPIMISKTLFSLSPLKKKKLHETLLQRLENLS